MIDILNNNWLDTLKSLKMIWPRLLLWCQEFISHSKLGSYESLKLRIFVRNTIFMHLLIHSVAFASLYLCTHEFFRRTS